MIEIIRHKIERCLIYFRQRRSFAYKVISGPWLPAAGCKPILPFLCATHIYRKYIISQTTNGNFVNGTKSIKLISRKMYTFEGDFFLLNCSKEKQPPIITIN